MCEACSRSGTDVLLSHFSALGDALPLHVVRGRPSCTAALQLLQAGLQWIKASAALKGNLGFLGLSFLPVIRREQKCCPASLLWFDFL